MIGTRAAGTAISRRIVMAIGNGVVRSNSPTLLKENGGSLELTEDWARGVIKSMNWTKRKGTTGKIEPLNKPAKSFIKEKYNMWHTVQVAKQLNEGKAPADVEVSLNLSEIKPLHAKWIYEMYEYLRGRSDLVLNGFESAGITEAVEKSNEVFERIENPFLASRNDKN